MAKAKKITKKKAETKKIAVSKKKVTAKKKSAPKKKPVAKKENISVPDPSVKKGSTRSIVIPEANTANLVAPPPPVDAPTVNIPTDQLVIELCAPGKRCKQRPDGSFIRQNFISGRWVQVGGTTFPSLKACKNACGG
jgi:hypothetical protein